MAEGINSIGAVTNADFSNPIENDAVVNSTENNDESIFTAEENITDLEARAREGLREEAIENFSKYLEEGYEDKAMESYRDLIDCMNNDPKYANLSDDDKRIIAKDLIEKQLSEKFGQPINLGNYIIKYAANAGERQWQMRDNMFDTAPRYDETTEEDLLNEICGRKEEKSENEMNGVTNVLSYVPGFFASCWNNIFGAKHF